MEVDDGFMLIVDRAIHCFGPAIQQDLHLLVVVLDKLDLERCLTHFSFDLAGFSGTDVDRDSTALHVDGEVHVVTPIADLFPHIFGTLLDLLLAEVIHQK